MSDKTKSVDKYFNDAPASPETTPDIVWPEDSNNMDDDAEKYGYGDAEPGPRKVIHGMPRRSSLKSPIPLPRRASIGYTGEMVLTLPTGETKKRRTSISFDKEEENFEIQPLTDMVDNPDKLWFNESELQHIKRDVKELVAEMKAKRRGGDEIDRSKSWLCTRGLEPLMYGKSAAAIESTESVLEEYALQKSRGEYDEAHIREMYSFHTIDSQIQATERAEYDAREIETELKLSRRQSRRMSC